MRLNHLNLCVGDLAEAKELFQNLFDFELEQQKGDAMLVMNDRCGFTLVASNPQAFGGEARPTRKDSTWDSSSTRPNKWTVSATGWPLLAGMTGPCRSRAISGAGIRCILRPWEESCSR
ncbi:hypothetical protein CM49_05073 [Paenibacillus sp. P1XP2]|nr:hypothetical protein CM49_05073 [Paenibacillus sp. P1XP2]